MVAKAKVSYLLEVKVLGEELTRALKLNRRMVSLNEKQMLSALQCQVSVSALLTNFIIVECYNFELICNVSLRLLSVQLIFKIYFSSYHLVSLRLNNNDNFVWCLFSSIFLLFEHLFLPTL